jgi:hypothetical protein
MVTGAPQTVPVHRGHKSDSSRVSGCSSVRVRAASAGTRSIQVPDELADLRLIEERVPGTQAREAALDLSEAVL